MYGHPIYSHPALAFVPALILAWAAGRALKPGTIPSAWGRRTLYGIVGITCAYYAVACLAYAHSPSFMEHTEPGAATASLLTAHDEPLYTDETNPERLVLPYGPAASLVGAAMLKLVLDPIRACKLAGAMLALASMALVYSSARRHVSRTLACGCVAYCALNFAIHENTAFMFGSDVVLIFGCALACWSIMAKRPSAAFVASIDESEFCSWRYMFVRFRTHRPSAYGERR